MTTIIKPHPIFVIDTREQTPYGFPGMETIRMALPTGDYSLWGFESRVAIERKTLDDYIHTIIHDRERWLREQERLQTYELACVIVEADLFDIRRNRYTSRAHPNSILGGTAGARIVPATTMEFPDDLGDKIRFYSHSYSIGVSPFDLDITSDRNIKFHSDTVPDLMVILGDQGDVQVKEDIQAGRDVIAGDIFKFSSDSAGDKFRLYGTLYRLAISSQSLDFYSDSLFTWHSDSHANAMQLDADTGRLSLTGPLHLPVYTSLPSGTVGDLIYYDSSTDSADGAYVYTSAGWSKL